MSIKLSVAIITKNEEENLPRCLSSVSFVDDIVVVDSGSTDKTVDIASEFGCRVFIEDWKGDGPQKESAIRKCVNDWVLVLDADERVPEETKIEIVDTLKNPKYFAYSFPRKNYFHGRWIRHSGFWPDRVIRLMRKDKGRYASITHGRWSTEHPIGALNFPIEHFSFSDYSDMLSTLQNYSSSIALEMFNSGRRSSPIGAISHGLGMFLKTYFLKLGFLDGFDGLIIALTKAGGSFFKYAKLYELQKYKK